MKLGQLFKSRFPSTEDSGTAVFLTAFSKLEHHSRARSLTAVVRNSAPLPCCGCASMFRRSVLLLRYQAVRSPPVSVFSTIVARSVCLGSRARLRVRVLVRLGHPRPPDRNQHGCTVGVLPGPTRVLPMPRQYGIGRRAPTRAVLSCAASWCLVVRRPHRRVDCLVLTSCYVSSRICVFFFCIFYLFVLIFIFLFFFDRFFLFLLKKTCFHFFIFFFFFHVPSLFLFWMRLRSPSLLLGGVAWFLPSMGGVAVFPSPVRWCCSLSLGGVAFPLSFCVVLLGFFPLWGGLSCLVPLSSSSSFLGGAAFSLSCLVV